MREEFDAAICVSDQEKDKEVTGLDTNRAYMPNDLDSDNETRRSIVANAKFVTESVEMDFSKEEPTRDHKVLFQKVIDKVARCNETIDDLDANCFVQIINDFKVSNFGRIFSRTGYPKKAEHPEYIKVKQRFRYTLAIRRSEWNLLDTVWFDAPWQMEQDQEEFMLSSHLSKMAAQQGVNSAKATLKDLTISEVAKMVDTAIITVSDTTIVAVGNSAVDGAASTATGTMKPAPGATVTTEFGSISAKKLIGPN